MDKKIQMVKVTSGVVDMKNVEKAIPSSAYENKTWNEDLAQYYVEYTESGKLKKCGLRTNVRLR